MIEVIRSLFVAICAVVEQSTRCAREGGRFYVAVVEKLI
jgi:hypothetical protein